MSRLNLKYYIAKRLPSNQVRMEDFRLLMSIHYQGKRYIYYPGIYLSSFQWDKALQKIVNHPDMLKLNILLRNLETEVKRIFESLAHKYISIDSKSVREELSKINLNQHFALTNALILFIEKRSETWSRNSYLKFKGLYNKVCDYELLKGSNIGLEEADERFMTAFSDYLIGLGLQNSTLITYMRNVKTVLRNALNEKWMINRNFLNYVIPGEDERLENRDLIAYLNYEEIIDLYHEVFDNRKLEQCRDIFCLIAFTGIRYSEIKKLKVNDLSENRLIIEGKRSRIIPLNQYAINVLNKYKNKYYKYNSLLPAYSEITVNKYLQQIFENKQITFYQREDNTEQRISISSAYNTFMANAVHFGISPLFVRKWSANKTLSRYSAVRKHIELAENSEIENINKQIKDEK